MIVKGQKLYSIVNIVLGVILTLSAFMMFTQPDTFPGPLIVLPLGLLFWIMGASTLRRLRECEDVAKYYKKALTWNMVLFIFSCVILAAVVLLPILAPRF